MTTKMMESTIDYCCILVSTKSCLSMSKLTTFYLDRQKVRRGRVTRAKPRAREESGLPKMGGKCPNRARQPIGKEWYREVTASLPNIRVGYEPFLLLHLTITPYFFWHFNVSSYICIHLVKITFI